ncbi:HAD family hydrolase [Pleionea litopenaei]|uniref:HAD family phosphatase n=1 Tax=Pleionea litopenaei TaxID=3070815 RepID=A0AA51RQT2_9GAMM|nr:HAD family phosphatase [Pleionea sp. HL-JVS1]WMS85759.1 HAD family phosphatase [Pleionea sp. HL-JVS1]
MAIALFDLDHTLLQGDSDPLWGDLLFARHKVTQQDYQKPKDRFYQDYLTGSLDINAFLQFCAQTLSRLSTTELTQLGEEFRDTMIRPRLSTAAIKQVYWHKDQGHLLAIVTTTNEFLANWSLQCLPIDHLIASPLQPTAAFPAAFRDGKRVRFLSFCREQQRLPSERTWFYSDSHNDLPLLNFVSDPVAVNPDQRLNSIANQCGWPVLDWS